MSSSVFLLPASGSFLPSSLPSTYVADNSVPCSLSGFILIPLKHLLKQRVVFFCNCTLNYTTNKNRRKEIEKQRVTKSKNKCVRMLYKDWIFMFEKRDLLSLQ